MKLFVVSMLGGIVGSGVLLVAGHMIESLTVPQSRKYALAYLALVLCSAIGAAVAIWLDGVL